MQGLQEVVDLRGASFPEKLLAQTVLAQAAAVEPALTRTPFEKGDVARWSTLNQGLTYLAAGAVEGLRFDSAHTSCTEPVTDIGVQMLKQHSSDHHTLGLIQQTLERMGDRYAHSIDKQGEMLFLPTLTPWGRR